jgi:hypothetical protein
MNAAFGRLLVSLAVLVVLPAVSNRSARAQSSVQYKYEDVGNTRFLVTEQTVQRAVPKTDWLEKQQTVYRERYETQWQTNYRTYLTPVTEYRQELYLANRWNPLAMPYWTYRYVPVTRWESRQEPYSVPITQRTWVPETQTVRVPQTTVQIASEQHVSRVAVGPAPTGGPLGTSPSTAVARRETIGGVQKLE